MRLSLVALVAVALSGSSLAAESNEGPQYARPQAYAYSSPSLENQLAQTRPVHRKIVRSIGGTSIRIFFREVNVFDGGFLVATSLLDGSTHVLTPNEIAKWSSTTGYFNGDSVLLELWLAPGQQGSYEIDHLLVGHPIIQHVTICGVDDRVPSNDNRAVRMLNGSGTSACSGWLISTDDCVFSAGHCMPTYASVAEVNVPASSSGGGLQHPPLPDQFPVNQGSLTFTNGGTGNDFGLGKLFTNNLGQSASALHGFYSLATSVPNAGETIRVVGYGSDDGNTNQTHQTDTGPFHSASGTALRYTVDTTGGNSGSVVIHESSGQAIAIHTHGGCTSSGGFNTGTSVLHSGVQNLFSANCSQGGPPTAEFSVASGGAVVGVPVAFSDTSSNGPSTWAWDFDEDAQTDSTAQNPTFTYASAGTYDVTLTVTNTSGSDSVTVPNAVTVVPLNPVSPPYIQNFTHGLPSDGSWTFGSSNSFGDIASGSNGGGSPGSGGNGLLMGSTQDASDVTNESTLFLNLDATGNASLRFWFKEFSDENDPEDGVFLSDGSSEVQLVALGEGPATWTSYTFDLAAAASGGGLNTNSLRVTFRQNDNYPIPTDGHAYDDVELLGTGGPCGAPITYGQGEVGLNGNTATIGSTGGDPTAGNTDFAVTLTGGPANAFTVLFSASGQAQNNVGWGTILVGGSPFTRTMMNLDGNGTVDVLIPITGNLIGLTRTFQFACRDPGFGGNVQASDALQVTYCP